MVARRAQFKVEHSPGTVHLHVGNYCMDIAAEDAAKLWVWLKVHTNEAKRLAGMPKALRAVGILTDARANEGLP